MLLLLYTAQRSGPRSLQIWKDASFLGFLLADFKHFYFPVPFLKGNQRDILTRSAASLSQSGAALNRGSVSVIIKILHRKLRSQSAADDSQWENGE